MVPRPMPKQTAESSKNPLRDSLERLAAAPAAHSVLFILLGLGVLWLADEALGLGGDAVLISLLVLPALLYLALSGMLTEITGPGGVGAKFKEVAHASWQSLEEEDVEMVTKSGLEELRRLRATLPHKHRPIVLTLTAGHLYDLAEMKSYAETLGAMRRFLAVVFENSDGILIGYMRAPRFEALMRSGAADAGFADPSKQFVEDLSRPTAPQLLVTSPGVISETLPVGATNREALEMMTHRGLEVLALVDNAGRCAGVVERSQVISNLVLASTP